MKRPNSCVNLKKAIERLPAGGRDAVRLGRALANVVLGQMLPDGVVKGGSALLFRYGGGATRYTRDVDTARAVGEDRYFADLEERLEAGWCGFTGRIVPVEPAAPRGVPPAYVMKPFDVKLSYHGKPWMTVHVEVGHNEIGDADAAEAELAPDLAEAFETMGFPRPAGIPVMRLPYQIAQKLHAASSPGSIRAHDLVDLQLVLSRSQVDLAETAAVCRRLFSYRRRQPWPPRIVKGDGWDALYDRALGDLGTRAGILPTVDEAVARANDLIARIAAAPQPLPAGTARRPRKTNASP